MLKIVFHLNCLEQGGAERVVTNLSAQFAEEGYEVIVATEWQAENEFTLHENVRRVHVGLSEADESKSRISKYFIRIRNLRAMLKQEKPDLLIAFAHKANYRSLMATLGTRFPVLISVRTDPVGHYDSLSDKILIPWLFPRRVSDRRAERFFSGVFTEEKQNYSQSGQSKIYWKSVCQSAE